MLLLFINLFPVTPSAVAGTWRLCINWCVFKSVLCYCQIAGAGSRWWCGPSRKGGRPRAPWTCSCPASPRCPASAASSTSTEPQPPTAALNLPGTFTYQTEASSQISISKGIFYYIFIYFISLDERIQCIRYILGVMMYRYVSWFIYFNVTTIS